MDMGRVPFTQILIGTAESVECRARSDSTYVQACLTLHSPQTKSIAANGRLRVNVEKQGKNKYTPLLLFQRTF